MKDMSAAAFAHWDWMLEVYGDTLEIVSSEFRTLPVQIRPISLRTF